MADENTKDAATAEADELAQIDEILNGGGDADVRRAMGLATSEADTTDPSDGEENAEGTTGSDAETPTETEKEPAKTKEETAPSDPQATESTEVEVGEFPFTLQIGDKSVTFDTEDAYNTWVENVENQSKAWKAIHDRNARDKAERIAAEERRVELEKELAKYREAEQKAKAPVIPEDFDLSMLDPDSQNYNPKVGLAKLQGNLGQMTAALKQGIAAPTAQVATPGESPAETLRKSVLKAEDDWKAAHFTDLTEKQKADIDTIVTDAATALHKARLAAGSSLVEADVETMYGTAYAQVTGKAAAAKAADPAESVKQTSKVLRLTLARAKNAPKASKQAPPPDAGATGEIDPNDDNISFEEFKAKRLAGRVQIA